MNSEKASYPVRDEITIKFGKGLIGNQFTSKSGKEMVQVKIPNRDSADKTPWESFAVPASFVHENNFSNGLWMKLPADGSTKLSRPLPDGKDDMGRTIWKNEPRTVSNKELKSMVEAYKERPRDSILGNLEAKKGESKAATPRSTPKHSRDTTR